MKKSPKQWAIELNIPQVKLDICSNINKWEVHDYHYQADPITLTKIDFIQAIEMANSPTPKKHKISFNSKGQ